MNWEKAKHWIVSTVVAMLGGGAAAAAAAMADPEKYRFPQDIGTGKLWKYIFAGWGLTFMGILIKSPLGQKVVSGFKETQDKLAQTKDELQQTKDQLKQAQAKLKSTSTD